MNLLKWQDAVAHSFYVIISAAGKTACHVLQYCLIEAD